MSEFVEYPKWMAHPHAQKSVPQQQPSDYVGPQANTSPLLKGNTIGTVEKLPPVQVMNADEEEQYAAKGYAPAGKQNPWAHGSAQSAPDPSYTPEEYPKWVGDKLVNNSAEEAALYPSQTTVADGFGVKFGSDKGVVLSDARPRKPHPLKGKKLGPRKPKAMPEAAPVLEAE